MIDDDRTITELIIWHRERASDALKLHHNATSREARSEYYRVYEKYDHTAMLLEDMQRRWEFGKELEAMG